MPRTKRPRRDPLAALEYCLKLAGPDGLPPKTPPDPRLKALIGVGRASKDPDQEELKRLEVWLDYLASVEEKKPEELRAFDAATAYLAILQVWLDAHYIQWPDNGVFAANLGSAGRGRPSDWKKLKTQQQCYSLREENWDWKSIAIEVFPEACADDDSTRDAARKAKDYAKTYAQRRNRPGLDDFRNTVYKLLGIETWRAEEP